MTAVIEVSGLRKSFGQARALDGLDLTVAPGEVHGFLGPNGAGKTTTIRVLLGLIRAGGGTARLFGGDPWRETTTLHRRLAYVPGDVTLWPNLSGGEVIDLLGRLRGGLDEKRKATLLEKFGLEFTYVDTACVDKVKSAMRKETKVVFLETPTNPMMTITDLRWSR